MGAVLHGVLMTFDVFWMRLRNDERIAVLSEFPICAKIPRTAFVPRRELLELRLSGYALGAACWPEITPTPKAAARFGTKYDWPPAVYSIQPTVSWFPPCATAKRVD